MGEGRLRPEVIPNSCCPAARSLEKALKNACFVLSMEFKIPEYVFLSKDRKTCVSLRTSWEDWTKECLQRHSKHSRRGHRLALVFKSTKRLFDVACKECDPALSSKAKMSWREHVGKDVPAHLLPSGEDLDELRRAVRENLSGWGRWLESARVGGGEPALGEYVPDQQGCYELRVRDGGTLACGPADYSGDWSAVRMGVAKTKGKFRVVTMQSAEVKRVLTPVHNALYNYITSFGWCVRGDVQKEDFETIIRDRREGEFLISGDYQSATDNIYLPAVFVIVDEISKSPELTVEERSVLLASFEDLRYKNTVCELEGLHPIKRGSMMGNLISFPLLCLLNKSCFDIASNVRNGGRDRRGRFNGDDCIFAGDDAFFLRWRAVTGRYGLVVNEEKTIRSRRWLDLNSQSYDALSHVKVAKATLGFLRPDRHKPGGMLAEVVNSLVGFSQRSILGVITRFRHEIGLRGVLSDLGCLSVWLRKQLSVKRWFRLSAVTGGCSVLRTGVDRSIGFVTDRPPIPRLFDVVSSAAARLQRDNTEEWIGRRVVPLTEKLDRQAYQKSVKKMGYVTANRRFEWIGMKWAFVWPKAMFEVASLYPQVFLRHNPKWLDNHPFLTTRPHVVEARKVRLKDYPVPLTLLRGVDCLPRFV